MTQPANGHNLLGGTIEILLPPVEFCHDMKPIQSARSRRGPNAPGALLRCYLRREGN